MTSKDSKKSVDFSAGWRPFFIDLQAFLLVQRHIRCRLETNVEACAANSSKKCVFWSACWDHIWCVSLLSGIFKVFKKTNSLWLAAKVSYKGTFSKTATRKNTQLISLPVVIFKTSLLRAWNSRVVFYYAKNALKVSIVWHFFKTG